MRSLHRLYEGEASLAPKPTKNTNKQKKIRSNELTIKLSNLTCRPQIPFSLDSTACLVPLESHQM